MEVVRNTGGFLKNLWLKLPQLGCPGRWNLFRFQAHGLGAGRWSGPSVGPPGESGIRRSPVDTPWKINMEPTNHGPSFPIAICPKDLEALVQKSGEKTS